MLLLLYYLILPFIISALVLRLLKKYATHETPADIRELWERRPIQKKWFRALRRDAGGLTFLGDWEKQPEAVEGAYQGRKDARAAGEKAAFLVLNDKGELLEQIDS